MAAKNGETLKPKMLKEFLRDNNGVCTINEYDCGIEVENHLLQQAITTATTTTTTTNNDNNIILPRSRSRSRVAANAALSSFQKVLNAVKTFHHSSSSSPSTTLLQRSVSRRFLGKWNKNVSNNNKKKRLRDNSSNNNTNRVVSVKVKDILRWRSFRDVVADDHQDESQPLDIVGPINAPSSSNSSVDSDDEFTVTVEEEEELPWWSGNSGDDAGKNWEEVVASDSEVGPKEDYHKTESEEEGTEQQSPVSVLDSPFRDEVSDEEYLSTFDRSLANMERTKQRFLQSIQMFESLAGVHDEDEETDEEEEEDQPKKEHDIDESTSKAYLSKGFCWFERGEESLKDKKECIQGMEMQAKWSKFEEERSEVGVEMEVAVLNDLLDEVLYDLWG